MSSHATTQAPSVAPRLIPGCPLFDPHSIEKLGKKWEAEHANDPNYRFSTDTSAVATAVASMLAQSDKGQQTALLDGLRTGVNQLLQGAASKANMPSGIMNLAGALSGGGGAASAGAQPATAGERFLAARYRHRLSWSHSGLLAYCSQNAIMIVDPVSMQWVTSLDGHRQLTTSVAWSPMAHSNGGVDRGNTYVLASADRSGRIVVWNVKHARPICHFLEDSGSGDGSAGASPVGGGAGGSAGSLDNRRASVNYSAQSPASSAASTPLAAGSRKANVPIVQLVWMDMDDKYLLSLTSSHVLSCWSVDLKRRMWTKAFQEPVSAIHLDPFKKGRACLPCEDGCVIFVHDLSEFKAPEQVERRLRVGGSKDPRTGQQVDATVLRDFVPSTHVRDQLYFVSKREVSLYDLNLKQTILGFNLQASKSDFRQLYTCDETPRLFLSQHDDGSVAAWLYDDAKKRYEAHYCDVVRSSKHGADRPGMLYGAAVNPLDPTSVAAVSADGKIWVWKFDASNATAAAAAPSAPSASARPKWILQGQLESIPAFISSMVVSPFNQEEAAVGTSNGLLLVFDLKTGNMTAKHEVFSNMEVTALRWVTEHALICFSSKQSNAGNPSAAPLYQNHLVLVDLRSGKQQPIRKEKLNDSAPILAIRLSHSRRYLIILTKDRPIEVWNLQEMRLIRVIPVSNFTALEWCHIRSKSRRKQESPAPSASAGETAAAQPDDSAASAAATTPTTPAQAPAQTATPPKVKKEFFIFTSSDGTLYFYHVDCETHQVVEDMVRQKVFVHNQITAVAKVDNYLVCGDNFGNIICFEMGKDQRTIMTQRGLVKKILFSPDQHYILALFQEGDFGVFDIQKGSKISHSTHTIPHVKAAAVDWSKDNHPVIATTTGALCVYNVGLATTNESYNFRSLEEPLQSPALLNNVQSFYLRSLLENDRLPLDSVDRAPQVQADASASHFRNCFGELIADDMKQMNIDAQVRLHELLIPEQVRAQLRGEGKQSIAKRCLVSARYFGDTKAIRFWTLASRFLDVYRQQGFKAASDDVVKPVSPGELKRDAERRAESAAQSSVTEEEPATADTVPTEIDFEDRNLPGGFDMARENSSVLRDSLALAKQHDASIRANRSEDAPNLYAQVAQQQALLLQKDQAVKLLLETPPNHKDMYTNYLHACVIAAASGREAFEQTMQVVASSLISLRTEKDLMYGIEFLVLIGEGVKACRLLQDLGDAGHVQTEVDLWERSAQLAKAILPKDKSDVILTRWANHLNSVGDHWKAMGVWMSLGLYHEVLSLLRSLKMDDVASLFSLACEQAGVAILDRSSVVPSSTMEILRVNLAPDQSGASVASASAEEPIELRTKRLLYAVYAAYGRLLERVGNVELSQEYVQRVSSSEVGLAEVGAAVPSMPADAEPLSPSMGGAPSPDDTPTAAAPAGPSDTWQIV